MNRILLTGSTGLVGSNIIENKPFDYELLHPDVNQLDLLNITQVENYIKNTKPDLIIHAAGIVGGIEANIQNPVKFLTLNTLMANNLIITARNLKVKYFLNLGSSCMYPRNAPNPLKETMILNGELEPTNEGYALAKIFAQRLCSYINKEELNKNFKTIIPCNLYGRWDKFDPHISHMIPSVIRKIHEAKITKSTNVEIWGDGQARREFLYAGDLADFIWYAVDNIESIPENINIGLGYDYSINEYYKIIAEVIGFDGNFEHNLTKPVGMKQKLTDISLQNSIKWYPKHSLKEGVFKTYKFFLEKYT